MVPPQASLYDMVSGSAMSARRNHRSSLVDS